MVILSNGVQQSITVHNGRIQYARTCARTLTQCLDIWYSSAVQRISDGTKKLVKTEKRGVSRITQSNTSLNLELDATTAKQMFGLTKKSFQDSDFVTPSSANYSLTWGLIPCNPAPTEIKRARARACSVLTRTSQADVNVRPRIKIRISGL